MDEPTVIKLDGGAVSRLRLVAEGVAFAVIFLTLAAFGAIPVPPMSTQAAQ
jgi:hypothetical protein